MVEQLSTLTQCMWIMFTDVDFSVDHQHVLEVFLSPCRIHPVFNAVLPEVSNITFLSLPHRDFTRLCVVDVIFKVFAILHSGTLFRCFFFTNWTICHCLCKMLSHFTDLLPVNLLSCKMFLLLFLFQ